MDPERTSVDVIYLPAGSRDIVCRLRRGTFVGGVTMRRRELITILGGAVLSLPLQLRAQQSSMPVIGYLGTRLVEQELFNNAFRRGLKEMGLVEGQNVTIEYLSEGDLQRLPEFVADMVRRRVSVIFTGNNVGALAAKATSDIPIVFIVGLDPVAMGLVSSINRPGGNATGVAFRVSALEPKRFELLRTLLPQVSFVGALVNPDNPNAANHVRDLKAAASGQQLLFLEARSVADFDVAFATLVQKRAGALLVTSDPLFNRYRLQPVELAARNAIPAMYPWRDFTDAGGLMSYGNSLSDAFRQGGVYTGRILKGDKAADLPVWQPTKFEFVINLKTAKMLGIDIPPTLLAFADEVIE
jgi:putative tryptophan/tyrosine transport system substrate-binding protein